MKCYLLFVKLHRSQVFTAQYEIERIKSLWIVAYIDRKLAARHVALVVSEGVYLPALRIKYAQQQRLIRRGGCASP